MTRDSALRARLQSALARAGLDLLAIDPRHSLQVPRESPAPPLLVLLDLRTADVEAARLSDAWRDRFGAQLPIIVIAESVQTAAEVRALHAAGVTGYLSASTDEAQLMPALAPWLGAPATPPRAAPRADAGSGVV